MKKGKRLLILLAAVAVFGVGAYLLNLSAKQKEAAEDTASTVEQPTLISTSADTASGLEFSHGDETVAFSKKDSGWVYAPRESFELDTSKVDTMISSLVDVQAVRTVSDTNDSAADYGLEKPAVIITVTDPEGNAQTLSIGDKNSTTGDYYASVDGKDGIYTISSDVYNAFDVSLMSLLTDESFPSLSADQVTSVEWNDGQDPKTLVYEANGDASAYSSDFTWFQQQADGTKAPISDDQMTTFLEAVTGITYQSTVADAKDDLAEYGLEQPLLSVTLHYTEDVPQSQADAAMAEEAAAATATPEPTGTITAEPTVTQTPAATEASATTQAPTASPTVTAMPTATATATTAPSATPTATSNVNGSLASAMAEDASAVPSEAPTATPTATPEPTVTVQRTLTIWLGKMDEDGNVYMTHSKTNRVFLVSKDTMTSLMALTADGIRVSKPIHLVLSELTGMTATMNGITKTITSAVESTTDSDGNQTATTVYQMDGQEIKTALLSYFINTLKAISAESYTDQPVATNAIPVFNATFTQNRAGFETVAVSIYPFDSNFDQVVVNDDATMLVNKRDVENLQTYFDELVATQATATPEATATPAP